LYQIKKKKKKKNYLPRKKIGFVKQQLIEY
jgi:hypothetical protein